MKLVPVILCSAALVALCSGAAEIDPSLKQRFSLGDLGQTQNVMVSFTQSIQTVINQINQQTFSNPDEKRTALTNAQKVFTDASQKPLQTFLNGAGIEYKSFWINNAMTIPNVNSALINAISNVPGVAKIEKEPKLELNIPIIHEIEENSNFSRQARQSGRLEWGIQKIRANQVWDQQNIDGWGIVVANIDTGVRYTHETLKSRYRSSYGWYDPYSYSQYPSDNNGHGTHTMGTIAGSNGVGVAKLATWIACAGCTNDGCGGSELMECGQWIQCPTLYDGSKEDCSKAPHIVSNSWGGNAGGQSWYDNIISSWRSSGIIPVFSIGNSGPSCSTARSPGDRNQVISVGSTESDDKISRFSSLGPARDGTFKPDIAAPGGNVRSAWYTSDNAYASISGTSMAAPHVSGVIAMMMEKKRGLSYKQIYDALAKSAVTSGLDKSASNCANRPASSYPNNVYGYGRLDALNAVNAV